MCVLLCGWCRFATAVTAAAEELGELGLIDADAGLEVLDEDVDEPLHIVHVWLHPLHEFLGILTAVGDALAVRQEHDVAVSRA